MDKEEPQVLTQSIEEREAANTWSEAAAPSCLHPKPKAFLKKLQSLTWGYLGGVLGVAFSTNPASPPFVQKPHSEPDTPRWQTLRNIVDAKHIFDNGEAAYLRPGMVYRLRQRIITNVEDITG
jgi:hypothetical protein